MITDIPGAEDFKRTAINHLHLAWSIGVDLLRRVDVSDWDIEIDEKVAKEFWRQAQPALANAITLTQQAQEFGIKGLIAAVSPYLLITRDPRDWPRRCDREALTFADFRTADAADLIKIHDTVSGTRLPAALVALYDQVRKQRNVIMHHGYVGQQLDVADVFLKAVQTYNLLFADGESWPETRRAYLESDAISEALYLNDSWDALLDEFDRVVELLKPAQLRALFGFDKRARRYVCPNCMNRTEQLDRIVSLAQLRPNSPDSTEVYCFVCEEAAKVGREVCNNAKCKSNVILDNEEQCLGCWR
jgi:hypothetical protein